jgi:hypothetical protein
MCVTYFLIIIVFNCNYHIGEIRMGIKLNAKLTLGILGVITGIATLAHAATTSTCQCILTYNKTGGGTDTVTASASCNGSSGVTVCSSSEDYTNPPTVKVTAYCSGNSSSQSTASKTNYSSKVGNGQASCDFK